MHTFEKQAPSTTKKIVLKDVKNSSWNLMGNHQEGSQFMEQRPVADTIKFCGTKRYRPQNPISHTFLPTLGNPVAKEQLTHARNILECELGHNRNQNSASNYATVSELRPSRHMLQEIPRKPTQIRRNDAHYVPAVAQHYMAPNTTFSYLSSSLPSLLGKPNNGVVAAKNSVKASQFANFKRSDNQHWEEQDLRLQNSLKRCDESDNRNLVQRLCQLSPTELSMYAFELENKAIQLAIEEEKEVQRMKELSFFANFTPTTDPLQTTELWQSRK